MRDSNKLEIDPLVRKIEEVGESLADDVKDANEKIDRKVDAIKRDVDELYARQGSSAHSGLPEPVSLAKVVRGLLSNDWSDADYERHVVLEVGKERALSTGTDTAGGYLVPVEYLASEFVDMIYAEAPAFAAGVRRLSGLRGSPVTIPRMSTGATAYWVAENSTITGSDQAFGQVTLTPRKLAAFTRVSNELLSMSTPAAEQIVRDNLARSLSVELDRAIWQGSGASGEPIGILNTSGINATTITGAATLDTLWGQLYEIEKDNALIGPPAFAMSWKQWHVIRKAADSAGQPKYYVGAGAPIAKEAYGIPVHTTANLDDDTIVAGCFGQCVVGEWGGLQFLPSQHASDGTNHAYVLDQTWIRATMIVDVAVLQPLSFCADVTYT